MASGKRICSFILLVIPSILIIGLLVFSILSDSWQRIRTQDLANFKLKSEEDFQTYKQTIDKGQTNLDFFYIEKQWPLIKHDGLYSKCTEYHRLFIKVSTSYLTLVNKPLIKSAIIHYPKYILNNKNENQDDQEPCESPDTQVRCFSRNECVTGKRCNGIAECPDQTDEQFCTDIECPLQYGQAFTCDSKCWNISEICKQPPVCLNRNVEQELCNKKTIMQKMDDDGVDETKQFKIAANQFDSKRNCYLEYFDFKSAKQIHKYELGYLTPHTADNIQSELNLIYHLRLILVFSVLLGLAFAVLATLTLLLLLCASKLCLQCPFWFYGFFSILTFLSLTCSVCVYLYEIFISIYQLQDPSKNYSLTSEIYRMNAELKHMQTFCASFWSLCAALCCSLIASILSCVVCCRMPTMRHQDKEYEIMDLRS